MNNYNIIEFLENNNIEFSTSGKNVTAGWVEINCPYRGCSDPSMHCGINLQSGIHSCWICGKKGNMPYLVKQIFKISLNQAKKLLHPYKSILLFEEEEEEIKYDKAIDLSEFQKKLPTIHRNYLVKRGFDPDFISRKYKIRACYQTGKFPYRLIIPVFQNGILVNITARDVTGTQDPKYKNLSNEEAIIPMKNCLYNIDAIKEEVIICEGVTDVWKIGDKAIATMGTAYTSAQLKLLYDKRIKKATVLFDPGANEKAENLANAISSFIKFVEIIYLDKNDPANLSSNEIKQLGL